MFASGSRRPLIRSNSHDRPAMRNWPLFAFLFGLVFLFYGFYIFQAQNAELNIANEQINELNTQLLHAKNKVVDSNAQIERLTSSEKNLANELSSLKSNYEDCSVSIRSSKLRVDSLDKELTEKVNEFKRRDTDFGEMKLIKEELERNNTALVKLVSTQDTLVNQLNQTVNLLQQELGKLRSERQQNAPVQQNVVQRSESAVGEGHQPEPAQVPQVKVSTKPANADSNQQQVVEAKAGKSIVSPPLAEYEQSKTDAVPTQLPEAQVEGAAEARVSSLPKVKGGDYVERGGDANE